MSDKKSTVDFSVNEQGILTLTWHGEFTGPLATELLDKIQAHVEGKSFFLLECLIHEMDGATPEARRIAAQRLNELPPRAMAIVGGSFGQRLVAKLIVKATALLGKGGSTGGFFNDSESAHKWLGEYRQDQEKKLKASS